MEERTRPGSARDRGMARSARRVIAKEGVERAHYLLEALIDKARRAGVDLPYKATTAYVNTIPVNSEERNPGDDEIEERCAPTCAGTRWRWSCRPTSTDRRPRRPHRHASPRSATLYEVGFNHFFHGPRRRPTAATWSTSRATPRPASTRAPSSKGRLTEEQLDQLPPARSPAAGCRRTRTRG